MLSQATIASFKSSLRGEVIEPGDAGYDAARKVYNGMIDRRPRLIARCADVADVIAAVNFGREHKLLVAVRGGGHNAGGLGVCDDGLVIDLSPIKYVRVDPKKRTVLVGGGALWGDVDHATHAFGLAVPAGIISTTGVGGLTLGGGIGHLTRQCGLTIDNLLAVDMVLADGRFVTASAKEHADLFWAVRGGGGNFGVVTSFLFKAHPIHTDYAGPMLWPLEDAAEVMRWYRGFITKAPNTINGFFAFLTVPPGPPFPGASAQQEDVRHRLVLHRPAQEGRAGVQADPRVQDARRSTSSARFRIRRSRACSTVSTRRGCSGTGRPTSCASSATRPSRCTSSTARSCRPCSRRCICIRSTARRAASRTPPRRGPTATRCGPR